MTTTIERVSPHNLDAETSVLGAVIATRGKALDIIADRLQPHEFFRDAHQHIYRAMLGLYAKTEPVDFVTLTEALKRAGKLEACNGVAYVASLADGMPAAVNAPYYARIVREAHDARSVIALAVKVLDQAYGHEGSPAELIETAERGFLELRQHAAPTDLLSAADLVAEMYPVLEARWERRDHLTGVGTGFSRLDYYTHGLQPGALVILAGRPSTGKSSLALQMALHAARTAPVAFFSVEMSKHEQMFRVLSAVAQVDGHSLQGGTLSMIDQQEVGRAMSELPQRRFYLDDTAVLTPLQLRSRARRLQAKHGLALIVVDYLNLMKHEKADNREQQIASTTRTLKQVARELNVPVLALCQLNRKVDDRADKRPTLSDLRESGAIEQDADVVLLIWRPQPKADGATITTPPVELIIAKQRSGPTADIELQFHGEYFSFRQVEA